jgi:hypothetical protein
VLAHGRQEIVGCAVAQELIDVAQERRSALDEFGVNEARRRPRRARTAGRARVPGPDASDAVTAS